MNNDAAKTAAHTDDSLQSQSLPQVAPVPTAGRGAKESEPSGAAIAAEEAKLMKEILDASAAETERKLEPVLQDVEDAKLTHQKAQMPPDVEDAGVIEPEEEAAKVVANGPTIKLPISEAEYKRGLKTSASGKWYRVEREVVGVKSIFALALWVGKLVKGAHRHTMRVVFKKGKS